MYVGEAAFLVKITFLTPVTPNDPKSKCEPMSFVEGLKLLDILESRYPAM